MYVIIKKVTRMQYKFGTFLPYRVISTCALNPLSNAKLLAASPKDTPLNQVYIMLFLCM